MTCAPTHPSAAVVVDRSRINQSTGFSQMSLPKFIDPRSFRARFASYWSDFIHANYRSPEEVSVSFGVTFQTACNWWHGTNRPSGDVVARAGRRFTEFMEDRSC